MATTSIPAPPPTPPSPRRRILTAALELVASGGYERLQVRALSKRANVSSRTIYTHFGSLDSLLLVAVAEQLQPLYRRVSEVPPTGGSPVTRVNALVRELSALMTANRELTLGMLRALLSGKPDVVPWVRVFRDGFETVLAITIAPDGPTARDREAATILQGVWFSALIGFAIDTDPTGDQITAAMRSATERVLANDRR